MKKHLYIFVAALGIFSSCSKSNLDLSPYNAVEATEAFNTENDVNLAVNGMYYGLRTNAAPAATTSAASYYIGTWNIYADALADNLTSSPAGRGTLGDIYRWQYTASSNNSTFFAAGYAITRRANAILENIGKFSGAFADNAKGEALAVRAMTYFDMSRMFSKTYQNATDADFTLPYVTSTDKDAKPASEPLKGFYDKILADLNAALPLINATNGVGRLNKAAVSGLLSRVNLYKGDWAATIAAANNALGTTPNLPSIANFPLIWKDETESGVLFKIINTTVDNVNNQGVNYSQLQNGQIKSEFVVEYNFNKLFTPADIRTSTYIKTSLLGNTLYNNVVKYTGGTGKPLGVQDAKVLRTAEVLLNRMEAYYRSGNEGAALIDLNLLKRNRYTGFVDLSLSGQPLLDEILKERRLELAFEGDRFWDLKRRNEGVTRDGTKGEQADGTGTPYPSVFLTLPAGDTRFQFPYPFSETNFNPNLRQNPGY
jgi:hypothetical protein